MRVLSIGLMLTLLAAPNAGAQPNPDRDGSAAGSTTGTITSAGRDSIVLRMDDGQFAVFRVDETTARAQPLREGMRVSVSATSDTPAPLARSVAIIPARGAQEGRSANQTPTTTTNDPIPAEVREIEGDVERTVRRFGIGFETGVALDPELVSVGAHGTLGPIFHPNVSFRPAVELALGELTTLFAMHFDVIYVIPGVTRQTRWAPYVGAGQNVSFSHRGFEGDVDGQRFDFGDFEADSGFNFIVGMRSQSGLFFQMKATASGAANVRLQAGYTF